MRWTDYLAGLPTGPALVSTPTGEERRPAEVGPISVGTKILDFEGFNSSIILMLRGVILMSIGKFPDILSQAILVGIILVKRLGVGVEFAVPVQYVAA